MCLLGLYVFCRTDIVNCVRPFNGMVLSVMFLQFSVGYDNVEFYRLCYGTHLSNLFIGLIVYADDICLISHSCFGLQKMLDICYNYGVTWDILFNPVESHLITFGGSTPKATLQLNNDTLGW